MPRHQVRAPDGSIHIIEAPEGATQAQIVAYARAQAAKQAKPTPVVSSVAAGMTKVGGFGLADEISSGIIGAVEAGRNLLRGQPANLGGEYDEALALARARDRRAQADNPGAYVTGMVAGGIPAAVAIPARAPTIAAGARAGAATAAANAGAIGFGDAEGGFGNRLKQGATNAAIAGPFGAVLGGGSVVAGRALANRAAARATAPDRVTRAAVADAAARENIRLMPGDTGGAGTRVTTAAMAQTPFGVGPIRRGAQASLDSAQAAITNRAAQMGNVLDDAGLGAQVQAGARNYISRTSGTGGKLYDRAERLAGNATVAPSRAVSALDQNIAELGQNPATNKAAIDALEQIKADLATGAKPLAAVRDLRTQVRDAFANQGLRGSDLQRRVNGVMAALNDDIAASLKNNPGALAAYRRADAFWKGRVETIDGALSKVLGRDGNLSAEQATQRLILLSSPKGDGATLAAILRSLPKDARGDVAASVLVRLGKAKAGAQSAAGDAFSPSTFGTSWNNLTPQAKAALFPEQTHREAIDRIALVVIDGMKESAKFANTSNTGGAIIGGAMGAGFLTEPVTTSLIAAGQFGTAKLLSNPSFARWLAPTLRAQSPAQLQARLQVLPRIAAANPAIAAEVNAFARAANDNLARLAAEGEQGEQPQP